MIHRPQHHLARIAWSVSLLASALAVSAAAPSAAAPSAAAASAAGPAGAATAASPAGAAAAAARAAGGTHADLATLCRSYQHITVRTAWGARFVVKNDNYGGQRVCLSNRGGWPNFTVAGSSVRLSHNKPQAYPFIFRGCSWGTCSPDSGLPRQVSALRRPAAAWYTSQDAHGRWDAAFDIWFGTHAMTSGQADGAEVMIWLGAHGLRVPPRTPVVTLDHTRWHMLHWRACHKGTCWNYIQFRRVWPVTGVRYLKLAPFINHAKVRGWIKPTWWMENIEAGFELWQGGTGLGTEWFWARA